MNIDALLRIKASVQGENNIRALGNSMQGVTGKVKNLQSAVGGLAGGFGALTGTLTAIAAGGALKGVMDVFSAYQADILTLTQGLKNLGGTAPASLEPLKKLASDLGEQTLFNEEDFNKGFGLLTSFGNIAVEQYGRVAMAASDVAQVSGTDVQAAMMQLAKALNAPSQGVSALARSGIQFTEAQKDVIKELEETGRVAQAQELIFKELEKQYGGASVAAAGGFAGALDTMGEKIYDVQKALGPLIEQSLRPLVAVITNAADVLGNELLPAIDNLPAPVKTFAGALAGLTAGFVALKAAISGVLAITSTAAFASLLAAGPWIALAAGITAAAVALGNYRTESQRLSQSLGQAARGGGAADLARARNRIIELQQEISLAESQQEERAGGAGGGGRRGGQRSAAGTGLASLRAELNRLQQDVAAGEQPAVVVQPAAAAADAALGGADSKAKGGADKAASEAARLQSRLRALQIETQGTLQLALIKGKIAEAEMAGNKELAIRLQGEQRNQQILLDLQRSLEGITGEREKQALLTKAQAKLESAGMDTALEMERLMQDRTKSVQDVINGLKFEQVKILAVTDAQKQAIQFLEIENQLKAQGITLSNDQAAAIRRIIGENDKLIRQQEGAKKQAEFIKAQYETIGASIGDQLIGVFDNLIQKTKDWNDVLSDALMGIGKVLMMAGLNMLAGSDGRGILNFLGFGNGLGARANGGPVTSGSPYIVGERGPELFVPSSSGSVMSNADTRAALAEQSVARSTNDTRAMLEQQTATRQANATGMALQQKPIDVRYESTVINQTEYVTAEQHRKGLAQAAERGRALTLAALQNSTRTRKKVGI